MKIVLNLLLVTAALVLWGCGAATSPQASPDVKTQMLGRKPTGDEMKKAMGNAGDRMSGAKSNAQGK